MAETVREALRIMRALKSQAEAGFKEIVVRNPVSKRERVLVIPLLDQLASRSNTLPSRADVVESY